LAHTGEDLTAAEIKELARDSGFELAGVTAALPHDDYSRFAEWRAAGFAGEMRYLTDHRGDLRGDPRNLLPEAQSLVCVGKLYNTDGPHTQRVRDRGWISRYAWSDYDYHDVLRDGLAELVRRIEARCEKPFVWRICVDTAPLLERSYAQAAGLGWIGKNTCLINQQQGSWFFLGELLLSLPLASDHAAPERCGTCRRCIDACPTDALVPTEAGGWSLDARLCISYLTVEKRGEIPPELARQTGNHVFGCDICQDVCPWNRGAAITGDDRFSAKAISDRLEDLAEIDAESFRMLFRHSPVWRTKYEGFLRNVATAMGNGGNENLLGPLTKLASHPNAVVATAARRAIENLSELRKF
jgi:epoxyqueuosine reductase